MKLYEYTAWPKRQLELIDYEIADEPMFTTQFAEIKRDWTVLDVGASIGYYTLLAAEKATEGRVIAIEPHPQIVNALRKNVALHGLQNVQIINEAVAGPASAGSVHMQEGYERGGSEMLYEHVPAVNRIFQALSDGTFFEKVFRRFKTSRQKFTAQARTLDDLVDSLRLTRVDLVKMDIQGAEYEVLQGAERLMRDFHPTFLIEVHERPNCSPLFLHNFLENHGYRLEKDETCHTSELRAVWADIHAPELQQDRQVAGNGVNQAKADRRQTSSTAA